MKPKSTLPSRAPSKYSLAFAAMAAGLLPANAAPIAIQNASFEATTKAEGVDDYNQPLGATGVPAEFWRHWQRTENGGPLRIWNPAASGTTLAGQGVMTEGFGGIAPDGNQIQWIYARYTDVATKTPPDTDGTNYFSAAAQLLSTSFDPTKFYKLTVQVGNPLVPVANTPPYTPARPQSNTWLGYSLQLAAGGTNVDAARYAHRVDGGTVVAQDANSVAVPADQFRSSTVWYYPNPADAGLSGLPIQIRLAALKNPNYLSYTGYAVFDAVTLEEFAAPALAYWDTDDTNPGSGGASPTGTWDGANKWNAVTDGSGATAAWTPGQTAVFAAGADATGPYTVTVDGTQSIGGLVFEDGTVTLTGGTALQLAQTGIANVATGLTATVETPITESSAGLQLGKTGDGILVLSGANAYTGGTTVMGGTLRLGASNSLPDTGVVSLAGTAAGTTTLDLNGHNDTVGGLVLGGASASSAAAVTTGAGTLTLSGDLAVVNASGNGGSPLGANISGNLDLGASARTFTINNSATTSDDLTISATITGSVPMTKTGLGTLVLSGNNVSAAGGLVINRGATRFESPAAINGTARDVTVSIPGTVVFGSSFGAGNIPTALLGRVAASSTGAIAADNYASNDFDFNAAGLTAASLGAIADTTYTGTLTPNASIYRLGGGGGTLTLANPNALTGSNSAIINGKITLAAANNYSGGTTVNGGTFFEGSPTVLTLGTDNSIGTGSLTIAGATTIQSIDSTARVLANDVNIGASFTVGGTGDMTFTGALAPLTAVVTIAVNNPNTNFIQGFTGTGGGLTKSGSGTMTVSGINSYTGNTTVSAGTLLLPANNNLAGTITVSGGILSMSGNNTVGGLITASGTGTLILSGNNSAGVGGVTLNGASAVLRVNNTNALPTGTITLTAGTIDANNGAVVVSSNNPINFNGNFTFGGTNNLTFGNGAITNAGNRTITLNGTNSTLAFGGVMSNNVNNNQTTTVNGVGNTLVLGGYALAAVNATNRTNVITGSGNVTITGAVTNGLSSASLLTKNGTGTLTLQGTNTYTGNTAVNAGTLALIGGSQASQITVANTAFLEFALGSPTNSSKNLILNAGGKIRITGTPTLASYTLFTTTGTITGITGNSELATPVAGYDLVVETGNTLKLVAQIDPDYLAWSGTFLPTAIGQPEADYDGDGLSNDEERLFGLNPTSGTSVNPISVPLNPTAGTFSFTRRDPSLTDYIYTVYTSTDLQLWLEDAGAVQTPGAVVDQLQTVAVQLSAGLLSEPKLFVRMKASEAPPAPPLLDVDFEANEGGFTISKVAGTDWAWGAPTSTGLGGTVNAGNGSSLKCWGTNIGNPGYYVDPTTDSRLISPVIDLSSVVGAQLSFAHAIDIPTTGDSAVVRIFNADLTTEITSGVFPLTVTDASTTSANWQNSGPHVLPSGAPIRIVWTLTGTGDSTDDYMGWYVDDILVVEP